MGLYNFQSRFVPKVLAGEKTHTIRAARANPDKPGNTLHLYTGLRHKGTRLLMRTTCTKAEQIEIDACAAAKQVPWYPDAATMRYCFYSKTDKKKSSRARKPQ